MATSGFSLEEIKMEAWREELYHFGIKGMKWGVRKYQNEDGSLTDAGVKRYSTKAAKMYYKAEKHRMHRDNAKTFSAYKKAERRVGKAEAKADRYSAGLSKQAMDAGRRKVASSRALKFTMASVASAAATGAGIAAIAATGGTAAPLAVIGLAAGGGSITGKTAGRAAYYGREAHSYKRTMK